MLPVTEGAVLIWDSALTDGLLVCHTDGQRSSMMNDGEENHPF
jgi:hypothetical protein